jgi:hypothetical protein
MGRDQALAICEPQARAAGARANAQVSGGYAANQPSTVNCASNSYATNCTQQPIQPYGGAAFGQGLSAGMAGSSARDAMLTSCLAQYGYRIERRCISGC